jgi:hypothetical protein
MDELFRVHSNAQSVFELYDEKLAKVLAEDEGMGQDGVSAQRAAFPVDLLDLSVDLSDEPSGGAQPQEPQLDSDLYELAAVLASSSLEPNEPAAAHEGSQLAAATPAAPPEPSTQGGGGLSYDDNYSAQGANGHSPMPTYAAPAVPLGQGFGTPPPASTAPSAHAEPVHPAPASQSQPAAFNPFA